MDVKKIVRLVLLVGGVIVLVLSLTADVLGLGGSPVFGTRQILGAIGGAIAVVVGLILTLRK